MNKTLFDLTARYRASFVAKRTELAKLRRTLEENPGNAEAWRSLYVAVHRLSGSAGAYGFDDLGARALMLETKLRAAANPQEPPNNAILGEVQALERFLEESG